MLYPQLRRLKSRPFFTVNDLRALLGINIESARVLCSRYTKMGLFIRLKRNIYLLSEAWDGFSTEDFLKISNFLQVPSYISFTTALSFYEITTQVQRDFFESASLRHSASYNVRGMIFNYYKIQKRYYFDFIRSGNIFIATKEKAFIDSIYLYSFGKYKMDFSAIDLERLDKKKIQGISGVYPERTRRVLKKLCRI